MDPKYNEILANLRSSVRVANSRRTGEQDPIISWNVDLLSILRYVTPTFPVRLYQLIVDAEENGQQDIVHFTPSGDAFVVVDPDRLVSELVPQHFRLASFSSFRAELR